MCPKTNVATFQTAPDYKRFQLFCQQAELEDPTSPIIADPNIHSDVDDSHTTGERLTDIDDIWQHPNNKNPSEFKLTGKRDAMGWGKEIKEIEYRNDNLAMEFLSLHCRAGHVSFAAKLQQMARQGSIQRKFSSCPIPVCAACMYGKATRKRWRDKPSKREAEKIELKPGDKVSVDQMVSPTPGLMAQMTGILTTKRYRYATV